MQKIYCYVDETGQDIKSEFFIVVAVVNDQDQNLLRSRLYKIESLTKIGKRKWHKSSYDKRKQYLNLLIKEGVCEGDIYFGYYKKPIPYFLPMLEVIEKAVINKAKEDYRTIVYVDGIDRKKANELTNALRVRKVKLELVKSKRGESEPLIRLTDRWAGCIRLSFLNIKDYRDILEKAKNKKYVKEV
jgi:Protein of unknown function (DUF3800)